MQDRYTWGPGTVLEPGQVTTLCNSQASEFLLQNCDDTIGLGMNGNDAILLYSQNGDLMVRSEPVQPGCHAMDTPEVLIICFVLFCQIQSSSAIKWHLVASACSAADLLQPQKAASQSPFTPTHTGIGFVTELLLGWVQI